MAAATGHAPWRVLVVDDEENLNWSLVTSLGKEGYSTDGALSGEEALRRLEATPYDCVISDVKMPGMDGFELLQWLRRNRPQTRVIMMTAFGSPTARQDAVRAGVVAYLEKPFDLRTLKEELRRLAGVEATSVTTEGNGYDLLEVARVLNLARRDIALVVQGGGHTGRLRFMRGELVWAETGALAGDAAFLALCTPRGGHAQPEPWDGRSDRNVTLPVSHLIYQALATRDSHAAGATGLLAGTPDPAAPAAPAAPPTPTSIPTPAFPPVSAIAITETEIMPALSNASASAAEAGDTPRAEEDAGQPSSRPPALPTMPTTTAPPAPSTPSTPSAPSAHITPSAGTVSAAVAVAEPVEALARTLGTPCGVVLLRTDGAVVAQCWRGLGELPAGTYIHLASATQAAARALLLANLGSLEDARIRTSEHAILLHRVARGDRAAMLVAMLPREADVEAAAATLHAYANNLEPVPR